MKTKYTMDNKSIHGTPDKNDYVNHEQIYSIFKNAIEYVNSTIGSNLCVAEHNIQGTKVYILALDCETKFKGNKTCIDVVLAYGDTKEDGAFGVRLANEYNDEDLLDVSENLTTGLSALELEGIIKDVCGKFIRLFTS